MDALIAGLRALADPTRLRLLALCDGRELAVGELMGIVGQSQPRVSRHLKILTAAGLLERFREGSRVYYRVRGMGPWSGVIAGLFDLLPVDERTLSNDRERLENIRAARNEAAEAFFRDNAADWDRLRALYVNEAEVETRLLKALRPRPEHRLLDLGTGTGRILEILAPRVSDAIGLDRSSEMLKFARAMIDRVGLANASLRQGDLYRLPFEDMAFDRIVIHQVLRYLERPAAALDEAIRVLKPGGRLVVVDFAPHAETRLADTHRHRHLGFSDSEISEWLDRPDVVPEKPTALAGDPLTVMLWAVERIEKQSRRDKANAIHE